MGGREIFSVLMSVPVGLSHHYLSVSRFKFISGKNILGPREVRYIDQGITQVRHGWNGIRPLSESMLSTTQCHLPGEFKPTASSFQKSISCKMFSVLRTVSFILLTCFKNIWEKKHYPFPPNRIIGLNLLTPKPAALWLSFRQFVTDNKGNIPSTVQVHRVHVWFLKTVSER